ncbi:thioredoxin domain-containing protein [Pleurocapsa sp. FMAR1]|uniref:hypothetical protein n=1 Tax=Pleurocapsa sp. FMAR1 TaxID=3040204 RepID=UPI0029C8A580|nr:hypothetical protein [Pleurocapsa sp. FMAR1]
MPIAINNTSNVNQSQWIDAFSQNAMLLKRPLFVKDNQAVLVGAQASEAEIKEKLNINQ